VVYRCMQSCVHMHTGGAQKQARGEEAGKNVRRGRQGVRREAGPGAARAKGRSVTRCSTMLYKC
jgi:hypothetical protein